MKKMNKRAIAFWTTVVLIMSSWCLAPEAFAQSPTELMTATDTDAEPLETTAEEPEYVCNYIDTGERIEYYEPLSSDDSILYSTEIPSFYDSRTKGYVTSVKNQNPYGTCWAFAALGAGESSMLAKGLVSDVDSIDLSEFQFAYFFYHYANDPLGNLKGDYTKLVSDSDSYLEAGGNNYYSMFALSSWRGAADESVAPYSIVTANPDDVLADSLAFQDVAHMQNAYIVSMQNTEDIKKLIMEYGAVSSSMYWDSYYYNSGTDSYCCPASGSNHAIMLVGWNDDYSFNNFKSVCRPSNNGAWLVKNSWGSYAEYFWISYEDSVIADADAFVFMMEPADNYDFNYQYDGAYSTSYLRMADGNALANVFTVSGAQREQIEAASIALKSDNVAYSLQIYKNPITGEPLSGQPMLAQPLQGQTTYAGYYTIPLNQPIEVEYGDTFAVVFTLTDLDEGEDEVYCYADKTISGSTISFVSYTEPNQMYYCRKDSTVQDLYKQDGTGSCPRIKAFTSEVQSDPTPAPTPDPAPDPTPDPMPDPMPDPTPIPDVSVSDFVIDMIESQIYTGADITPAVTVRYGDNILVNGQDYTVTYSNNRQLGQATVTITGLGRYKGTRTMSFEIVGVKNPTTIYNGVDYSPIYDFNYYIKRYPDLQDVFMHDDKGALQHFVNQGMREGRQASASFDLFSYAYRYADLRHVFKNNYKAYYVHYIVYGQNEGRLATGMAKMCNCQTQYRGVDYSAVYDGWFYRTKYADIRKAFGFDDEAMLAHFVNQGMSEGRQAIQTFNINTYKKRYADLRKAFGENLKSYYMHYIVYGVREGRKAN